jgi:DNA-binding NarL/FixJ family response regulator
LAALKKLRAWGRLPPRGSSPGGEAAGTSTVETRDDLTAQQLQVAQLARDGLSNAEIGEWLSTSQHTVAYHLRKVLGKLGITSRNELGRVLPDIAHSSPIA